MNDAAATTVPQRARLAWQCRRGMLELDLLLQDFLDIHYDALLPHEQHAFETLLTYPDQLLLEYVLGRMMPADPALAHAVARLRAASAG